MIASQDNATTRRFLADLMVDDVAQKMHIARAATATGYGLDPCRFTRPFPGTSTQIIHQAAPRSPLLATALSAAGVLGGVLGGGGLIAAAAAMATMLWQAQAAVPAPAVDTAAAKADAQAGARIRVFWGDQEIKPDSPPATAERTVP